MILEMSLETFTFVHVVLSLVGIMTGFIVAALMLSSAPIAGWNAFFLISTILTSVTGFLFPSKAILPSHIVGVISLIVLAVAVFAVWARGLSGAWRGVYVGCAVLALYLNVFVAVVQSFGKFAYLRQFAPTGTEAAFVATQAAVLVVFVVLGIAAVRRYHPVIVAR